MKMDLETSLGMCMRLMSQSDYHRNWDMATFDAEITAAILNSQYQIYFDEQDNPIGLATWAWISDKCRQHLIEEQGALKFNDWKSGEHLLFNDYIAPWGHAKAILKDLRTNVFPDETAFSLGRNPDGSIRKIYTWKGINIKQRIITQPDTALQI